MQLLDQNLKPILLDEDYELANCFETLFDKYPEPTTFEQRLEIGFDLLEASEC